MGLVLFMGLFYSCDDDVAHKAECIGDFVAENGILKPRVWSNPTYHFDNILAAVGTLFEVITLDNWARIMHQAMDITEEEKQPSINRSWFAVFYFVAFVMIGSVLLTQVFMAVIIVNFKRAQGQVICMQEVSVELKLLYRCLVQHRRSTKMSV